MKQIKLLIIVIGLFLLPIIVLAQDISYYLILQDIGIYKLFTGVPGRVFSGPPSKYSQSNTGGVLSSSDHLSENDVSYEASYTEPASKWPYVKVEVTQHTGGDSDRWLLHEIEDSYRDDDEHAKLGLLIQATRLREIIGNKIIGRRGNGYTWISNNVVIDVSYTDLKGNKPEPLEIVQAYLAKFPSSITITDTTFKSNEYNVKWIKDEIDRRLWLCDKWNAQYQGGGVTQANLMVKLLENLDVFLKYRQKYFGISYEDEDRTLDVYHENNDLVSIQNKLKEYKTWWSANKGKGITLP